MQCYIVKPGERGRRYSRRSAILSFPSGSERNAKTLPSYRQYSSLFMSSKSPRSNMDGQYLPRCLCASSREMHADLEPIILWCSLIKQSEHLRMLIALLSTSCPSSSFSPYQSNVSFLLSFLLPPFLFLVLHVCVFVYVCGGEVVSCLYVTIGKCVS